VILQAIAKNVLLNIITILIYINAYSVISDVKNANLIVFPINQFAQVARNILLFLMVFVCDVEHIVNFVYRKFRKLEKFMQDAFNV